MSKLKSNPKNLPRYKGEVIKKPSLYYSLVRHFHITPRYVDIPGLLPCTYCCKLKRVYPRGHLLAEKSCFAHSSSSTTGYAGTCKDCAVKVTDYHEANNSDYLHAHKKAEHRYRYIEGEPGTGCTSRYKSNMKDRYKIRRSYGETFNLKPEVFDEIKNIFDCRCAYCGRKESFDIILTQDHFIPLSKQGKTEWQNILPACQKCNCSKNNMMPDIFLERLFESKDFIPHYCYGSRWNIRKINIWKSRKPLDTVTNNR